jgi:hypothetical protein
VLRDGVLLSTVSGEIIHYDYAARRVRWRVDAGAELRHPAIVRAGQVLAAPVLGSVVSFR